MVDKHGVIHHVVEADAPNPLWIGDITEHRTGEGKLYVCAFKTIRTSLRLDWLDELAHKDDKASFSRAKSKYGVLSFKVR